MEFLIGAVLAFAVGNLPGGLELIALRNGLPALACAAAMAARAAHAGGCRFRAADRPTTVTV